MTLNALLLGPEDTPYEYGMFEFLLRFPIGMSPRLKTADARLSVKGTAVRGLWGEC